MIIYYYFNDDKMYYKNIINNTNNFKIINEKINNMILFNNNEYNRKNMILNFLYDYNCNIIEKRIKECKKLINKFEIREFKPVMEPNMLNKDIIINRDFNLNNYDIVILKKNSELYKHIPGKYSDNYIDKIGFYSSYKIANKYDMTNIENGEIYKFISKKNIKLLNLNSSNNIKKIIFKQIKNIWKLIIDLKPMRIINNEIFNLYIISTVTGYLMTWDIQKKIIRMVKHKQIKLNGKNIIKNYNQKYRIRMNEEYYSKLYCDLNRASFGTYYDTILVDWICKNTKLDGYYNCSVPSIYEYGLWGHLEGDPYLDEEIALCRQNLMELNKSYKS